MKYRWGLYGDSETLGTIKIKKNMELNTVINTEKGALLFTYFRRNAEKYEEKALGNVDDNKNEENPPKVKKISVTLAHDIFGHMGEYQTRETSK